MQTNINSRIFNNQGELVSLEKEIGRGGEGTIYEIKGSGELVAKIYHKPINTNKANKLSLMVSLKTDTLLKTFAWPVNTLHEKPGGNIIGFLMKKVTGYKEIHHLYSPKSRLKVFPEANWLFLLHTATNIARAFNVVHQHGHVIGDVNHANILVSHQATIFLIDCDSFQVNTAEKSFVCEVGTTTHTPPELQGKSFREVIRNENHDIFGLSIIIFQLLFMGRHPFSGIYSSAEDVPLESAIKEYRFFYSLNPLPANMQRPPSTLSLSELSPLTAELFEKTFSKTLVRPKARDWVDALEAMSKNLKKCKNNSSHYFYSNLLSCAWCDIESRLGTPLFNPFANIKGVKLQIEAIQTPGLQPQLPAKNSITANPSPEARKIKKSNTIKKAVVCIVLIVIAIPTIAFFYKAKLNYYGLSIIIIFSILLYLFIKRTNTLGLIKLEKAKKSKEQHLQQLMHRWDKETTDKEFFNKKHELEQKQHQQNHELRQKQQENSNELNQRKQEFHNALKQKQQEDSNELKRKKQELDEKLKKTMQEYSNVIRQKKQEIDNLPNLRKQKLQQLELNIRQRRRKQELKEFLAQYKIGKEVINGIGKSCKANLQSYGIETAADINSTKLSSIPGFSEALIEKILRWRISKEKNFVFDPTKPQKIDLKDIAKLDNEIVKLQDQLKNELIKLQDQHEKEPLKLQDQHEKELIRFQDQLRGELVRLQDWYEKELLRLQDRYEKELLKLQNQYEKELSEEIIQLNGISVRIQRSRKNLYSYVIECLNSIVQLETDINFIKGK